MLANKRVKRNTFEIVLIIFLGILAIIAVTAAFENSSARENEHKSYLISKMKNENCVEIGYVQGDLLNGKLFEYICDGGKKYILRFSVQDLKLIEQGNEHE